MTFPNNDMNQGGQAVPATPQPQKPSGGDEGGGIRQWLIDSYNGLYKVVLEPSMPKIYQVLLIIFGALVGLLWAYQLFPTVFTGANPNRLNQAAVDQWVKMVAVGADANVIYEPAVALELLSRVPNPEENIQRLLNDPNTSQFDVEALQTLQSLLPVEAISAAEAPPEGGLVGSLVQLIILIVLIGVITPIFTLLWRILIYPNVVAGIIDQIKRATNSEYAAQRQKEQDALDVMKRQRAAREAMKAEASSSNLGTPVMQQLAIYTPGRSFDESYEIELESGEFLGQSGAVIAEATDPDPVGIEVWLFDIFNSMESKKIFITPQANADPSIRSRLESSVPNPATDIVVAQPGATLQIESDKIILQAKMSTVDFNGTGRFENFNMEMRAWQREGGATGAPTPPPMPTNTPAAMPPTQPQQPPAGRPMSDYDNMQFDPPPQMPSGGASSGRPMSDYDDIQFDPPPQMPSGSGGRSMSDYDDIQFDPPPQMPSGNNPLPSSPPAGGFNAPPPPPSGGQRLTPPPLNFPDDDDDDPFGGTGDFTPLGNEPRG